MSDDEKKERQQLALIATFGTGMVLTNILYWAAGLGVVVSALVAITAGLVAGAITWKAKSR